MQATAKNAILGNTLAKNQTKTKVPMRSGTPSINLPAQPDKPVPDTSTSAEGLQAVLDNLDALVYVSDFETHELLYMNAYGRRIWGSIDGRKCWQVLQDSDGPCSFCTNDLLVAHDGTANTPHVWEFQNQLDQRWYQCRDQAIQWTDGRLARLEIATDITERKNMELALHEAHERARAAAFEDELTRLRNRRAFFEFGNQLLSRALRQQSPMALIMMDLDHFKQVNDTHGHEAGDEVLRKVSSTLGENIRDYDILARMGGEEFALLLPETTEQEALDTAHRLLSALTNLTVDYRSHAIQISASFGITRLGRQDQRLEDLLHRADRALYRSKELGRCQVNLDAPL